MESLKDKVIVITGAGSGIGQAAALKFAAAGSKVVVADFSDKGGNETVSKIAAAGGVAHFVKTDVSDSQSIQGLIASAVETYGRLDFAFNNAGVGGVSSPTAEYDETVYDRTIAVDQRGVFLGMKYELQQFLKQGGQGVIVNMASTAGLDATPNMIAYSAAKHAVVGMTKTTALEYAEKGIRVNAICPGAIETPGLTEGEFSKFLDQYKNSQPMKRFGTPDEVANLALWLCSDQASFVNGIAMCVDGGLNAR